MHCEEYFDEVQKIANSIDTNLIEKLVEELVALRRRGGRLFFLGVGGSAANCSHAVNDFRKLCGIEAYSPIDNVSELTARANDEGWSTIFSGWLKVSRANSRDAIFVFSVGGGDINRNVSPNLVEGIRFAKERELKVLGVVGRDSGYASQVGDCVLSIPVVNLSRITPHSEAFQAVVWHCLVSHPALQQQSTKW